MPTAAYDHPPYDARRHWRGPCWLNTGCFALKGLKQCGFAATADAMRETILCWCDRNADALYEFYDSKTGEGLGAPHFGWSAAFVIELILNFGADSFVPAA